MQTTADFVQKTPRGSFFAVSTRVIGTCEYKKRKNNNNLTAAVAVVSGFIAGRRTKSYKSRFNDFQTVSYGHTIFILFVFFFLSVA